MNIDIGVEISLNRLGENMFEIGRGDREMMLEWIVRNIFDKGVEIMEVG